MDQSLSLFDREGSYDTSYSKTVIVSVILHVVLLILVPLVSGLLTKPKKFERPHTFELVSAPLPPPPAPVTPAPVTPRPEPRPPQEVAQPRPEPRPEPAPITPPPEVARPAPPEPVPEPVPAPREERVQKRVEEDVDALASLLDALPAPVQLSAPSDFTFHPYLNAVRNRIQEQWRPATENRNLSVVVTFTILADGRVTDVSVTQSSGNSVIDNEAMRAVQRAAPFRPLPHAFSGDRIEINCTLRPTRRG